MGVGTVSDEAIFKKLASSDFGIVCVTAENIENPWVLFESGGLINKMKQDSLFVMLADIKIEMLQRLNPPLARLQTGQLNRAGLVNLTRQICKNVIGIDDDNNGKDLNLIHSNWDSLERYFNEAIEKYKPLPNKYQKQIKYVNGIDGWNLNIPSIFSIYKKELMLVGLNHSYVLDLTIKNQEENFLAMVDSLLMDQAKKVKILISDIWDEYVIGSYKNMIQTLSVEIENKNITDSLANPGSEHYLEKVITRARGEAQLERIKSAKQLEIRKIKLVGDTFVFIDPLEEDGLCYFSLFSRPGGKLRPVFTFTKKDDVYIHDLYSNFIAQAWNNMSKPVWPPQ
jgi:hypothetical protein